MEVLYLSKFAVQMLQFDARLHFQLPLISGRKLLVLWDWSEVFVVESVELTLEMQKYASYSLG
jgi:hypothetical protein